MNPRHPEVSLRAGHRCEYCRAPEVVFNFPFEVEHIHATSRGGDDSLDNLALACRACNVRKSASGTGIDPDTGDSARLFHPRNDRWDQHFRADEASGRIVGLTSTGRATVARLEMNHDAQITARRQWMRLGLFP